MPAVRITLCRRGSGKRRLGTCKIDSDLAVGMVAEFPFCSGKRGSHYEQDNTIELQMPFIKYFFPDAKILPIGVPPAEKSLMIGERLVEMAEKTGKKLLVVGSTDLTHYGLNYGYTPQGRGKEALEWVRNENDRKIIE